MRRERSVAKDAQVRDAYALAREQRRLKTARLWRPKIGTLLDRSMTRGV